MTVFGDSGWESESDIPGKSRNLEFRLGCWVVGGAWWVEECEWFVCTAHRYSYTYIYCIRHRNAHNTIQNTSWLRHISRIDMELWQLRRRSRSWRRSLGLGWAAFLYFFFCFCCSVVRLVGQQVNRTERHTIEHRRTERHSLTDVRRWSSNK